MTTGFIDWTREELSLYVFERKGGTYELIDSSSVTLQEELNPSHIASLLDATSLDYVYLSIPIDHLTLREHDFPFSEREKINDTISFELEGLLLGNTSDYIIDHVITETLDAGSRVLAVCIEKTRLSEILDLFSDSGIDPKVITSIDIWLCGGNIENLLAKPLTDRNVRVETARQEILSPSVNLRKNDFVYTGDIDRLKKDARMTGILVLILLSLFCIHSILGFLSARNENNVLKNQIKKIYRTAYPGERKIVDARRQFMANLNSLKKKKQAFAGLRILDILYRIASEKDSNVTLYEFNTDSRNIIIKGTAENFESVESVRNRLASSFKGVKVVDSNATADKKINFTVVMQERSI